MRSSLALLTLLLFAYANVIAQDKLDIKWGKVAPADFDLSAKKIDTSNYAVIMAAVGDLEFEGNKNGGFSTKLQVRKRIKILNKKAEDLATVVLYTVTSQNGEVQVSDIKGATYNLTGDNVEVSELRKDAIFTEKVDKERGRKKFTLPNVKEGSIIEYTYVLRSDFIFNLRPWFFQDAYPVLWSEYSVTIPDMYNYVTLTKGYHPFHAKDQKRGFQSYTVMVEGDNQRSERVSVNANTTQARWVMKDVPALKQERFTSTLANHISSIEFQLSSIRYEGRPERSVMDTWDQLVKSFNEREDFGLYLSRNNGFLDDELAKIRFKNTQDTMQRVKDVFTYVRNNYTCTDHDAVYMDKNLRDVIKTKSGNVAEINLLLVALLRHIKLDAYPLILSTRDNGVTSELYPLIQKYNYVICAWQINNEYHFFDASRSMLGFDRLTSDVYNGHARLITENQALAVTLDPDALQEVEKTVVFISPNDKGKLEGILSDELGYFQSYDLRYAAKKMGVNELHKSIKKSMGTDVTVDTVYIDSLDNFDVEAKLNVQFKLNNAEEDILYISPFFGGSRVTENPFVKAERFYPVEMPYGKDETYLLNLELPAGYVVDEVPKSTRIKLNENDGMFEYLVQVSGSHIQLRSRLIINKATFDAEDYTTLRDFYAFIVKKHAEQIVIKKKS